MFHVEHLKESEVETMSLDRIQMGMGDWVIVIYNPFVGSRWHIFQYVVKSNNHVITYLGVICITYIKGAKRDLHFNLRTV